MMTTVMVIRLMAMKTRFSKNDFLVPKAITNVDNKIRPKARKSG